MQKHIPVAFSKLQMPQDSSQKVSAYEHKLKLEICF